ncbi:hypothetical protein ONE63_011455 [Megalurothrips usitatus]|uniref:MULE transposase domain-containing protein n=1 Tax=Megalurothrips usitatus TaxID=439358 RepID=A0AAV7X389_9NEOP|nr:hypothetical protein ONE63_011455 [Megalurothrips usitatus]
MSRQAGVLTEGGGSRTNVRWFRGVRDHPKPTIVYTTGDGHYFHREKNKPDKLNRFPYKCKNAHGGCPVRAHSSVDGSNWTVDGHEHLEEPDALYETYALKRKELIKHLLRQEDGVSFDLVYKAFVRRMLNIVRPGDICAIDCTFMTTPDILGAQQVLISSMMAYNQAYPLAFAVMQRKTVEAYEAVIKKLVDLGLGGKHFVADWEDSLRRGIQQGVRASRGPDDTEVWGCLWHYCKALKTHAVRCGLGEHLEGPYESANLQANRVKVLVRCLAVLPRLPHYLPNEDPNFNGIERGFRWIKEECELIECDRDRLKMYNLMEYWRKEWLPKTAELSVWGKGVEVTSGLESYNKDMNSSLGKRPKFGDFVVHLRSEEMAAFDKYQRMLSLNLPGQQKRRFTKKQQREINLDSDVNVQKSSFILTHDVKTFLLTSSRTCNKHFKILQLFGDDRPDIINDEDVSAPYNNEENEEEVDNPSQILESLLPSEDDQQTDSDDEQIPSLRYSPEEDDMRRRTRQWTATERRGCDGEERARADRAREERAKEERAREERAREEQEKKEQEKKG